MTIVDKFTSDKIRVLSSLAIIFVIYRHSRFYDSPDEIPGMEFTLLLQEAVSVWLGRMAVALFFMMSGFLFFRNVERVGDVFPKMLKRSRTLLVPYVIGALFFALYFFAFSLMPNGEQYMQPDRLAVLQLPFGDMMRCLFWAMPDTGLPYASHLWYLRDLIVLVALSPVIQLFRSILGGGKTTLLALILTYIIPDLSLFTSLFWFCAGDALLAHMPNKRPWVWFAIYLALSVANYIFDFWFWNHIILIVKLIGIIGVWGLYDKIVPPDFSLSSHRLLQTACCFTFFIFVYHLPPLYFVRKLLVLPLGNTSLSFALAYLLQPLVFAPLWVCVGLCFKRLAPRLYSVCTGGR